MARLCGMQTSDDQPVAVLRWHLSEERCQRESELAIATRTRWLRRAHWLVPLLLAISVSAIATQRELMQSGEASRAVIFAIGFVALVGILMAVDVAWKRWVKEPWATRRLWKDREAMRSTEVRIELFDDTIRYQGPQSTGTFSWSAIEDVARRDDNLLLTWSHSCLAIFEEELRSAETTLAAEALREWIFSTWRSSKQNP